MGMRTRTMGLPTSAAWVEEAVGQNEMNLGHSDIVPVWTDDCSCGSFLCPLAQKHQFPPRILRFNQTLVTHIIQIHHFLPLSLLNRIPITQKYFLKLWSCLI